MGDGRVDAGTLPRLVESIWERFQRAHIGESTVLPLHLSSLHQSPAALEFIERWNSLSRAAIDRYSVALDRGQTYWDNFERKDLVWNDSWNSPALILCLGALTCFLATFSYTRVHGSRRGPYADKHQSNGGPGVYGAGSDIDYDDTDYEDDSEAEDTVRSSITQPLRRIFNLRSSGKRSGSRDARRSGSIVRMTSSDPRSSLSTAPIHVDLDAKTAANGGEAGMDQSALSIIQHTASVARRRRESGRLLAGSSPSPARNSSPFQRSSSPLALPGSPARSAKNLRRNVSKTDTRGASAYTVVTSEGSEDDAESSYQDISLPSILKREPEVYASIPKLDFSSTSIYNGSSWSGQNQNGAANSADQIISGMPFFAHSNGSTGRLPPGAGYGPTSPLRHQHSSHKLGTLTADQAQALWPEKRCRKIRLKEPDWTPFVEVHDRARERLEAAAHVAANSRSASPNSLVSPVSTSSHPSWDESFGRRRKEAGQATVDQPDDEFWFERFTPSTAAAGRDWDWRKRRRARQQAQIAATAAEIEAVGDDAPGENRVNGIISDEKDAATKAGNVGLTDVQLQAQSRDNGLSVGGKKPSLSIATNTNVSARGGLGRMSGSPSSNQASSPLSKTLRLKRYSSTSSPEPRSSSPIISNGVGSSRFTNGSFSRGGGKSQSESARRRIRRASESDSADLEADGDGDTADSVSVPSRLSSLTPKLVKRPFSGKRERDAALTAQLLAEADEVATDEDIEQLERAAAERKSHAGLRKSTSSSILQSQFTQLETEHVEALPKGSADLWLAAQGAWSSADAYGVSEKQSSPPPAAAAASSQSPPHYANNAPLPLLPHLANLQQPEGGADLRRQGSAADSESSKGSGSQLLSGSDLSRRKSNSRRGILSSASSAAVTESAFSNGVH